MSFREKIDWLSLLATLVAFGWYFSAFPYGLKGTAALTVQGGMLLALAVLVSIVMTVAAIALALHKPAEANAPADERDRDITRNAATRAYYVMAVGTACTFAFAYYSRDLATALNMLLTATVAAETTRLASQIIAYRKGY